MERMLPSARGKIIGSLIPRLSIIYHLTNPCYSTLISSQSLSPGMRLELAQQPYQV